MHLVNLQIYLWRVVVYRTDYLPIACAAHRLERRTHFPKMYTADEREVQATENVFRAHRTAVGVSLNEEGITPTTLEYRYTLGSTSHTGPAVMLW